MRVLNSLSGRHRAILLSVALLSLVGGWVAASGLSESVARPDGLTRVLRGMVLIKAGMLAGAVTLVLRRLGREIGRPSRVGYTLGMAITSFAVGVLWSLSFIGLGSGLFYLGLLVALWGVSRDREMLRGWKTSEAPVVTVDADSAGDSESQHPEPKTDTAEPAREGVTAGSGSGPGWRS